MFFVDDVNTDTYTEWTKTRQNKYKSMKRARFGGGEWVDFLRKRSVGVLTYGRRRFCKSRPKSNRKTIFFERKEENSEGKSFLSGDVNMPTIHPRTLDTRVYLLYNGQCMPHKQCIPHNRLKISLI